MLIHYTMKTNMLQKADNLIFRINFNISFITERDKNIHQLANRKRLPKIRHQQMTIGFQYSIEFFNCFLRIRVVMETI